MQDNTKYKLKSLIESVVKEVVAEAKSNSKMSGNVYTETVKTKGQGEKSDSPMKPKGGQKSGHMKSKGEEHMKPKHAAGGKKHKMDEMGGVEIQSLQDLMQFLHDNGGYIAGVTGVVGLGKKIADFLKKNPEARKNADQATGAGSMEKNF